MTKNEKEIREEKSIGDLVLDRVKEAIKEGATHIGLTFVESNEVKKLLPKNPEEGDSEIFVNLEEYGLWNYLLQRWTYKEGKWEFIMLEKTRMEYRGEGK